MTSLATGGHEPGRQQFHRRQRRDLLARHRPRRDARGLDPVPGYQQASRSTGRSTTGSTTGTSTGSIPTLRPRPPASPGSSPRPPPRSGRSSSRRRTRTMRTRRSAPTGTRASQLTLRAEVFRKDHQNRFIGANDIIGTASYGALYVTGYTLTGANGQRHLQAAAHPVVHHPLRLAERHDVGHRQRGHRRLGQRGHVRQGEGADDQRVGRLDALQASSTSMATSAWSTVTSRRRIRS